MSGSTPHVGGWLARDGRGPMLIGGFNTRNVSRPAPDGSQQKKICSLVVSLLGIAVAAEWLRE